MARTSAGLRTTGRRVERGGRASPFTHGARIRKTCVNMLDGTQGLLVRRGTHVSFQQLFEESSNIVCFQMLRRSMGVERHEALDPAHVSSLRARAVVPHP